MKNEKLKRKHLVTIRLNDGDYYFLDLLSKKYNISYSKLLRTLLNSRFLDETDFTDYENK